MKMYKLATKNMMMVVQHLPSGSYDLSEEGSVSAAIEAAFADARRADDETADEELWAQVAASIESYRPSEALAAAENGEWWPIDLGFVAEDDE